MFVVLAAFTQFRPAGDVSERRFESLNHLRSNRFNRVTESFEKQPIQSSLKKLRFSVAAEKLISVDDKLIQDTGREMRRTFSVTRVHVRLLTQNNVY